MISNPIFEVTNEGVKCPEFAEIREYFQEKAKSIFGEDIYLGEDSADGQLLDIFASAVHTVNNQAVSAVAQFSPVSAEGTGLDYVVKVNGISRNAASYSTVDLRIIGTTGTVIENGTAIDSSDNVWILPATVTIPTAGEITVTATAAEAGAIEAEAGSITTIGTPTLGWQSVSNPAAATAGDPVETDAELRARQTISTMNPSQSTFEAIEAAILNINGVARIGGYNNQSSETNDDGIPAHSIALVVDGGNANTIAKTLWNKSSEGVGFYGSTTISVTDYYGGTHNIKFSRPQTVNVYATVSIKTTDLYTSALDDDIKQSVADYINSMPIGTGVNLPLLIAYLLAQGTDGNLENRYYLVNLTLGTSISSQTAASIEVTWNQAVATTVSKIAIEFVSN